MYDVWVSSKFENAREVIFEGNNIEKKLNEAKFEHPTLFNTESFKKKCTFFRYEVFFFVINFFIQIIFEFEICVKKLENMSSYQKKNLLINDRKNLIQTSFIHFRLSNLNLGNFSGDFFYQKYKISNFFSSPQ